MNTPDPKCMILPTRPDEFAEVIRYFLNTDRETLKKRGINWKQLPSFDEWHSYMLLEYEKPLSEKNFFCLSWYYDHALIGHSCIDNIEFGKQAFAHLHIWKPELRHKKLGRSLFWLSVQYYVEHFSLESLYCQPKADNVAPNKLLRTLDFMHVKNYKTIPHPICNEQYVNLYVYKFKNN
ncbi:MAG: GNAT family N-acetyltransferase [Legionellales bacterium]|nr:GNAT family N-acetyltransferase [Legionellales bacterium]